VTSTAATDVTLDTAVEAVEENFRSVNSPMWDSRSP